MLISNPTNPDVLMTRDQLAAELTRAGFPVRPKTLATKATRGGGPIFRRFGARPLYRWSDALAWAEGRLSPPIRNTSEADNASHSFERQSEIASDVITK
jgi:hypothetical protein